jgi:hypothetical protein
MEFDILGEFKSPRIRNRVERFLDTVTGITGLEKPMVTDFFLKMVHEWQIRSRTEFSLLFGYHLSQQQKEIKTLMKILRSIVKQAPLKKEVKSDLLDGFELGLVELIMNQLSLFA